MCGGEGDRACKDRFRPSERTNGEDMKEREIEVGMDGGREERREGGF